MKTLKQTNTLTLKKKIQQIKKKVIFLFIYFFSKYLLSQQIL